MSEKRQWLTTELLPADRTAWEELFRGYGEFYETEMPAEKLELVWGWIHDPSHEVKAIVVRESLESQPVGMAHYRPFARPVHGSVGCFLDDLFIAPQARGSGAFEALMARLREISEENGWDVVRWITSETNARARAAYERVAVDTKYVMYDIDL